MTRVRGETMGSIGPKASGEVDTTVTNAPDDADSSIRDLILEAAISVIDTRGEAAVRVMEIAAAAGVRHPSVYHYFGNRDGLIVAAQAERYHRSVRIGVPVLAQRLDAATTRQEYTTAVDVTIRSFFDEAGIARRRVRREVLGSAVFRPELAERIRHLTAIQVEELVEVFSRGRGSEWLTSPYDLDAVMFWWLGTVQGRQFTEEHGDQRISDQWDDLVARAVLRALFGADAAADPGETR